MTAGITAWTDATLEAELADTVETIAYGEQRLKVAQQAEADQVARSMAVYGYRHAWPASSVHASEVLEAATLRIVESLAGSREYLHELTVEQQRRELESVA